MVKSFNTSRDIDISTFIPEVLKKYAEIRAICISENEVIDNLWEEIENAMNRQFLDTTDIKGISIRERMFGIVPFGTDTVEDRRFRLLTLYGEAAPYTRKMLENALKNLCGGNGYHIFYDNANHDITVKVDLGVKKQKAIVTDFVERISPCNMTYSVDLLFNIWSMLAEKTWGELNTSSWHELREEVMA